METKHSWWDQFQDEHAAWSLANFGQQQPYQMVLGMIEELGELDEALNELHDIVEASSEEWGRALGKVQDAIGDVIVYMCGFCTLTWRRLGPLVLEQVDHDMDSLDVHWGLTHLMRDLAHTWLKFEQAIRGASDEDVTVALRHVVHTCLCLWKQVQDEPRSSLEEAVKAVWERVVQKRDWRNDPEFGKAQSDTPSKE